MYADKWNTWICTQQKEEKKYIKSEYKQMVLVSIAFVLDFVFN